MAQKKKKIDELTELDETYYQLAGKKKAAKKKNPLIAVCVVLSAIVLAMGCFMVASFGSLFDSFLPMGNVTIGNTNLRGMTKQEAKEALVAMQQEYLEKPMVIRVLDSTVELTGAEAKIVFDIDEVTALIESEVYKLTETAE